MALLASTVCSTSYVVPFSDSKYLNQSPEPRWWWRWGSDKKLNLAIILPRRTGKQLRFEIHNEAFIPNSLPSECTPSSSLKVG